MPKQRKRGYYWVKRNNDDTLSIAFYTGAIWYIMGCSRPRRDNKFDYISDNPIVEPEIN